MTKEQPLNSTNEQYSFDEYIRCGEPQKADRARNWATAIGLQAVDGLHTSDYLRQVAVQNIEGDIDIDKARELVKSYYTSRTNRDGADADTEEADRVSANIAKVLSSPTFAFSVVGLTSIHRQVFDGVFKFAGKVRDYDITKREWVLDGDTVLYVNHEDLRRAIAYDLDVEKRFSYAGLSRDEVIAHIAGFVAGLWQIHPFGEGNTRTTAVFTIKYLHSIGFKVNNDMFRDHSWYFRNALVRANYRNVTKGIEPTSLHLERFFRNLLLGENHQLKNRHCHVAWQHSSSGTEQVPSKHRASTEQADNPSAYTEEIKELVRTIADTRKTIKEMLHDLGLRHRMHFVESYLNPAMEQGLVTMLYPNSPRHPRQRYLLTVKGLLLHKNLSEKPA